MAHPMQSDSGLILWFVAEKNSITSKLDVCAHVMVTNDVGSISLLSHSEFVELCRLSTEARSLGALTVLIYTNYVIT